MIAIPLTELETPLITAPSTTMVELQKSYTEGAEGTQRSQRKYKMQFLCGSSLFSV
jgi:hypothetical protein